MLKLQPGFCILRAFRPTCRDACHRWYASSSSSLSGQTQDRRPNTVSIRLYRIMMRHCHRLQQIAVDQPLFFQSPLNPSDYGQARLSRQSSPPEGDPMNLVHPVLRLFRNWNKDINEEVLSWLWNIDKEGNYVHFDSPPEYDPYQDTDDDDDNISCLWVTAEDLKVAIRSAFETSPLNSEKRNALHRVAIQAIRNLQEQEAMLLRTSVSFDLPRGVRVVAASRCIGTASSGHAGSDVKHRFAYRIRLENLRDSPVTVQLLGRTWLIQEEHADGLAVGEVMRVDAPTTGAVGHLPVLEPGMVFEYMSGCELATRTGHMSGCFHLAEVPPGTESGRVGDSISHALSKFEMPVHPFPLVADQDY